MEKEPDFSIWYNNMYVLGFIVLSSDPGSTYNQSPLH